MICCAPGCGHKSGNGCHFYNFPSPNDGPDWEKWYKIWVLRINRVTKNGDLWRPETPNTKLCSCHFHPEQQWDPKSRKGGLKCKEPVFFEYNRDLLSSGSSDENCQVLSLGSPSTVENSGIQTHKRIHHDSNPSNAPLVDRGEPAAKISSMQSTQRKIQREKLLLRSCSTAPKLKIREYFQHQDDMTSQIIDPAVNDWSTSSKGTEQQYLIPNVRMPHTQYSQLGPRFVSADDQTEVACTQVMYPDGSQMDFLEVAGSGDNSEGSDTGYSSVQHQMCIKHELVDSPQVVHVIAGLPEQNPSPVLGVKIETAYNPLRRDSTVVDSDEEVLPRIISSHSLESDILDQEGLTEGLQDQRVSSLHRFVDADPHETTPEEHSADVSPKNPIQKTKISNVKPIRIFTSKRIGSGSKVSHDTLSVGPLDREEAKTTSQTGTETVYDQIFNHLASPTVVSQQDSSRAAVSQDNTGSIEDMLSDHLTSTDPHGHLSLNQALERVKELEKALSVERFGLHRFMASDEKIKFYTGFRSVDTLMRFFWRIEPDDLTSDRSSKWKDAVDFAKETLHDYDLTEKTIPYMDELFLFLCHVWLGLQPEDLADRFALPSTKHALFIILRWVYYLHVTLPSPSLRAQCTKSARFQGQYCNTRLLLQPVRIKVQQKSILNHLSSTRLNCLICFSPSGEVVFTSDPISDVSSSMELVQRTGILPLLQRGESIIVEGEFMRDGVHLFSSVGVKVHHLPSFDLPHNAATFKRGSSPQDSHKCHTEVVRLLCAKIVRTVTAFKCLQDLVLDPVSHVIKDLWKVCCLLVNYQQGFRSL